MPHCARGSEVGAERPQLVPRERPRFHGRGSQACERSPSLTSHKALNKGEEKKRGLNSQPASRSRALAPETRLAGVRAPPA